MESRRIILRVQERRSMLLAFEYALARVVKRLREGLTSTDITSSTLSDELTPPPLPFTESERLSFFANGHAFIAACCDLGRLCVIGDTRDVKKARGTPLFHVQEVCCLTLY